MPRFSRSATMVADSALKPRRVLDSATFAPEPRCWAGSSSSTPGLARDHWFDSSSQNHSSGRKAPSRCPSDFVSLWGPPGTQAGGAPAAPGDARS